MIDSGLSCVASKSQTKITFQRDKNCGWAEGGRGRNNYQGLHAVETNFKYLMSVFLTCKPDFSDIGKLLQKKPDDTVIAQNHRLT